MSLRLKLIILFLAVTLIPLLFVSTLTFHNYKNSLETTCLSNLQNTAAFKADKIETYFAGLKDDIEMAQGFYNIKQNLPVLIRLADDPNNPLAAASRKILNAQLQQMQSVSDMTDIMLVNPKGKIVYANKPGHYFNDMTADLDAEKKAFTEGKDRIYFSEAYFDSVEDNRFEMLVTAPASDLNGRFIGVIAFEVDMATIYKVIQDVTGLGNTGEVLVGKKTGNQVVYINPLRHEPQTTIPKKITLGEKFGGPIQKAVQGKMGVGQSIDYRGKNVIAAWRYIPSLDWGLVAKIDTDEAFIEVIKLRNLAIIILAIVIVLSSITAFSIARSIAEPIKKLSEGAAIIGSGRLDYKIEIPLKDEVGQLSRAFDKMTRDLKQTTASRDELNKEITERKQIEDALRFLVQCGEPSGGDFFLSLARYLGETLGMNFVCIDRLEEKLLTATTVAVYSDGKFEDNVSYTLKDTPCGDVVGKTICCFPKDVCQLFPRDTVLATLAAESYLGTTLWSSRGQPIGLIAIIGRKPLTDTTVATSILQLAAVRAAGELERRQAEESLRESREDLNRAQTVGNIGSWRLNIQINELTWSDQNHHIFGIPKGTPMTYETFLSTILPDDREFVDRKWQAALQGEHYDIEHRILVDDQIKWVRERAFLEFDPHGVLLGGFGTSQDITERKKAEEAVLVSEVRYRRLFEAARDGILILDADSGQIVNVNPFIKDMLGYSQEEFLDKKIWEIGLFKDIAASKEAFLELQDKDYIRYENLPLETKDGRRIAVEFVSNVYLVDRKKVFQCNIRDITDRIQAEEALQKSHDELEMRVKERTHELAETVNILEDEVRERIGAEKTAKTERKRFEDVLEMMPAYAVLLTEDYHVAYANRTFRDWFGNDNGKKCYEFLFNRTQPCEDCQTYTVLKTNKSNFWEWTGPNGHNYDIYDYPFTDTDGSPLIMEIGVDVTTHKKAQEAVRQGEERYRSLTVATTQLVWTTDDQGLVVADMPAWRIFTGQSIEDIQGSGWINALHPEDRDRTTQIWAQSLQEKSLYQTEYRVRRHDGEYRYMSVRGVPVIEPDGRIREWVGTCTDITERKLAEDKQAVTKSLLELFVKNNSRKEYLDAVVEEIRNWSGCHFVGIRIKDSEQNIPYESCVGFDDDFLAAENALHLNRDNCTCMRAILEIPQPSAMNLTTVGGSFYCNDSIQFSEGLSEQDKKEYRFNCIRHGFLSIAVIPIRYRDEVMGAIHITDLKKDMVSLSKIQFIENTIAPLVGEAAQRFNAEAELEKYRLNLEKLVRQRTLELEKANRQLQSEAIHRQQIAENLARSNKDLEQFAYVASHDLQEPLRAVAGFVDLLKRNLQNSLDDKTAEYMNFTIDGARRMQSLVNGLLEYSRVSAKGKKPEQTDSKEALDLAIAHLLTSIKESQAAITADDLPKVNVDAVQLTQLFQNLIGNAIKFHGPQPPQIHISAARQDHAWQFAVADNGIGIEPQYAERIFLIFHRLHTRQKYPGTGIGLAICKKIIERHGGKIWVESKPEIGSTFYFTIPDGGQTNNENGQLQS